MSETRNDAAIRLLTEIRDELRKLNKKNETTKPKPRNLPTPISPDDDPNKKRKLVENPEGSGVWYWVTVTDTKAVLSPGRELAAKESDQDER